MFLLGENFLFLVPRRNAHCFRLYNFISLKSNNKGLKSSHGVPAWIVLFSSNLLSFQIRHSAKGKLVRVFPDSECHLAQESRQGEGNDEKGVKRGRNDPGVVAGSMIRWECNRKVLY